MSEELTGFQSIIDSDGNFAENWHKQEFVKEAYGDGYDEASKTIAQFKRLPDMFRSYANTKKMVGADTVVVPKADADEKAWGDFYARAGRPEAPDKYNVKYDGMEMSEDDKTQWQGVFHKLGLNDRQVQGLVDHLGATNKAFVQKMEADAAIERKTADEKLRAKPNYNELMLAKDKVLAKFDTGKVLEQLGVLDEPEFLEFLGRIGAAMSEDTLAMGVRSADSQASLRDQISELERHPAWLDPNHPEHIKIQEKRHTLFMRLHD